MDKQIVSFSAQVVYTHLLVLYPSYLHSWWLHSFRSFHFDEYDGYSEEEEIDPSCFHQNSNFLVRRHWQRHVLGLYGLNYRRDHGKDRMDFVVVDDGDEVDESLSKQTQHSPSCSTTSSVLRVHRPLRCR